MTVYSVTLTSSLTRTSTQNFQLWLRRIKAPPTVETMAAQTVLSSANLATWRRPVALSAPLGTSVHKVPKVAVFPVLRHEAKRCGSLCAIAAPEVSNLILCALNELPDSLLLGRPPLTKFACRRRSQQLLQACLTSTSMPWEKIWTRRVLWRSWTT